MPKLLELFVMGIKKKNKQTKNPQKTKTNKQNKQTNKQTNKNKNVDIKFSVQL